MKLKFLSILIILSYILSGSLKAQVVIQKINDLNFGDVFIGYSATVTDLDPNAAKFRFYHSYSVKGRDFRISFQLPDLLTNGFDGVKIYFNNYAAYSKDDIQIGRTYFNPYSPITIKNIKRNDDYFIWLGGQIVSTPNITPGYYQGTIILTIEAL